jgi:hypothetical protein
MVSADHFGYELRRPLNEAAAHGANELLLKLVTDLCRSVRSGPAWLNTCCEAMEQELANLPVILRSGVPKCC